LPEIENKDFFLRISKTHSARLRLLCTVAVTFVYIRSLFLFHSFAVSFNFNPLVDYIQIQMLLKKSLTTCRLLSFFGTNRHHSTTTTTPTSNPTLPKRVGNSFSIFCKEYTQTLSNEVKGKEKLLRATAAWRALDDKQKEMYRQKFRAQSALYKKQKTNFLANLTKEETIELEMEKKKVSNVFLTQI